MTNICNFCLKLSNACISVDESLKETIGFIFNNVEFEIAENSLICEECIQQVQLSFNLKSGSIKMKCEIFPNELETCRFCITVVPKNNFYILEAAGVDTNVSEIITTYLPEIDLTVTNKPIWCNKCFKKLEDFGTFINNWLDIYNLKKKYLLCNNKSDIFDLNDVRKFMFDTNIGLQHLDKHCTNGTIQKFEVNAERKVENSGEERNKENRNYIVENIQVKDEIEDHEFKYSVEGMQIKMETVSGEFQFRDKDLKIAESKQKMETLHFEPKIESEDYVLKEEEISIYDVKHDDESDVFEEYSEINLNTQFLCNDNPEMKQEKSSECSSSSEHEVPTDTGNNSIIDSSFFTKSVPKMTEKLHSSDQTTEQLRVTNSAHLQLKTGDGFRCVLCPFQNQLEAKIKVHFQNYHSKYSHLILDEIAHHERNSDKFENPFGSETQNKNNIELHLKVHADDFFKCNRCDFKTKYKQSLKRHLTKHCDNKTQNRNILKWHVKIHPNVLYKCKHCDYKTEYKNRFKKHRMVHADDSNLYKCELCAFNTKYKNNFKKHLLLHSDVCKLYKCEHCDYKTKQKIHFKKHLMMHSDECNFYDCKLCDFKTKFKNNLETHLIVHSDRCNFYQCELCDFKTKYKISLKRHLIVHSVDRNSYKCEHCDYKTQIKNNLEWHVRSNSHGLIHYKCDHCNYKTKYKKNLKTHLLVHSDECDLYKCELCDFKSKYKNNLKKHQMVHSDDCNLYKCEFCEFKGKHKISLKSHLLVHSHKLYKCEHCDYKTQNRNNLKRHVKRHSDNFTLYKCEHCDYKTKYNNGLKKHLIVHSDDINFYQCEHCDFKTKYKQSLPMHSIVHSDDSKLLKCEHCDFKTKYKNYLKLHLIKHSDKYS